MVKVKSQAQIQKNYADAAGTAGSRYSDAIDAVAWQAPATAGQALYVQQMTNAEVLKRRATGIAKVPDAEFKAAMREKGAPVIAGRMAAAAPKMAAKFAPFKAAIEGTSIPARVADPIQNVTNRLIPIVKALVAAKKAQS